MNPEIHDDETALGDAVRRAYPAPDSVDSELKTRVLRLAQTPEKPSAPNRRGAIRLALAASAVAGVGLFAPTLTRRAGNPSAGVAFANVEKALTDVKTVTFTERTTGTLLSDGVSDFFLRTQPLTLRIRPRVGVGKPPGRVMTDFVSREHLIVRHDLGTNSWSVSEGSIPSGTILDIIRAPKTGGRRVERNDDYATTIEEPWESRRIRWTGRDALEFVSRVHFRPRDPRQGTPSQTIRRRVVVDPESFRVIHGETTNGGARIILEDFRYDEALPESTFTLAPPVGKEVRLIDNRLDQAPIPEVDAAAAKAVVSSALDAWTRSDWESYARLWDFRVQPAELAAALARQRRPNPFAKKDLVADEKRNFSMRAPVRPVGPFQVTPASGGLSVMYTHPSASAPFPPEPRIDSLKVSSAVELPFGPKKVHWTAIFTVRRQPDKTWKIVRRHFSY